jgi:hypothetical protein
VLNACPRALRCVRRRRRAGLPPLADEELSRAVRQLRCGAAALMVPAAMSLSRSASLAEATQHGGSGRPHRHSTTFAGQRFASTRYEQTPEQIALARRQFVLALRTACYGTALGVLLATGGVTALAWRNDVHSWRDARDALRRQGAALRGPIREVVLPWRRYAQSWVGARCAQPGRGDER